MTNQRANNSDHNVTEIAIARLLRENEFLETVAGAASLDEILHEITAYVQELWGFECVMIQLVDEEREILRPYAQYGASTLQAEIKKLIADVPLNREASISAAVALEQKARYIRINADTDLSKASAIDRVVAESIGFRENLLVPLIHQNRCIAVFHLMSFTHSLEHKTGTRKAIEDFMQKFTGHIFAAKDKVALEELKAKQQGMLDLVKAISACFELNDILDLLGQQIERLGVCDAYSISLVNLSGSALHNRACKLPASHRSLQPHFESMTYSLDVPDPITQAFQSRNTTVYRRENVKQFEGSLFDILNLTRIITLPICKHDHATGTVMLMQQLTDYDLNKVDELEELIPLFYDQIQKALYFSGLQEEKKHVRAATSRYSNLVSIINRFNKIRTVEEMYAVVLDELLKLFRFDLGVVFIERNGVIEPQITRISDPQFSDIQTRVDAYLKRTKYRRNSPDGATSTAFAHNNHFYFDSIEAMRELHMSNADRTGIEAIGDDAKTLFLTPIRINNTPVGIIWLWSLRDVEPLNENEIDTLNSLTSYIGAAIDNSKLFTTVQLQNQQIETLHEKLKRDALEESQAIRQQLTDLQTLDNLKDAFIANVSHELRTPINNIMHLIDLALDANHLRDKDKHLLRMQNLSKSLLAIVNDILDFSKAQSGTLELEARDFDLTELINNFVELITGAISDKSIKISTDISSDVPTSLVGDPLRLTQILINLGSNAAKFTEQGEIRLSIKVDSIKRNHVKLEFAVNDTGKGIAPDQLDGLFHSFTSPATSEDTRTSGTGLGLSITKQLVEKMAGEMRVESALQQGSKFTFTAEFQMHEVISDQHADQIALESYQILLINGHHEERQWLSQQLTKWHAKVVNTDSFALAFNALGAAERKEKLFSAIVVDSDLLHGEQLALFFTSLADSHHQKCPVIIVGEQAQKESILRAQPQCFYTERPLGPAILKKTMSKLSESLAKQNANMKDPLPGSRILVVEDNEINRIVACEILKGRGVVTEIAENGQIALEKLAQMPFDLVLMDIQMPVMDGLETTRQMRKDEKIKHLPIIAMTANASTQDRERGMEAGMNEYLTKPLQVPLLMSTLEKYLALHQPAKSGNAPVSAPVSAPAPAPDTLAPITPVQLPNSEHLTGLDIDAGLKRIQGNRELYESLLFQFADEHRDTHTKLRRWIEARDYDKAEIMAHNLNALAADLAATEVHIAARELESTLRQKRVQEYEKVTVVLEQAMLQLFESIASLRGQHSP